MELKKNRTVRVIWSVDVNGYSKEQAQQISESNVDGVRIGYTASKRQDAVDFVSEITKNFGSLAKTPMLMLDITPPARGKLVGFEDSIVLESGSKVKILPDGTSGDADFFVQTSDWENLFKDAPTVYVGYGDAVLKPIKVSKSEVIAEVDNGGTVKLNSELHVPGTRKAVNLNIEDLKFDEFRKLGVNALVIPGSISLENAKAIRAQFPSDEPSSPWLFYRIDSQDAYEKVEEMISFFDGVIISRRELALTANPALVPILTKELIQLCRNRAKVTFVASEMLGSMKFNATPTRAEVSDIANAVYDGADALMLSEELSEGKYAQKAYDVAQSIIIDLENSNDKHEQNWMVGDVVIKDELDSVCINAMKTAKRVNAKAIVCITKSGNTAVRLSSLNTEMPIMAVTFDEQTKRKLSILRGVEGLTLRVDPSIDEVLPEVNDLLKDRGQLKSGDRIVFVTVTLSSMSREASNLFTIQSIS